MNGKRGYSRVLVGLSILSACVPLRAAAVSDWQAKATAAIAAHEYDITWQTASVPKDLVGAWHAPNRAQNLRTYFTAAGIRVVPREGATPSWEWSLALLRYGRPGSETLAEAPVLSAHQSRMTYDRGEIVESYGNDARGLTHEIMLRSGPASHVDLAMGGTLAPSFLAGGKAIDLVGHDGRPVLRYSGLRVEDSTGRALPARMEGFTESGLRGIRIAFDDRDAAYPVTAHAVATSPSWTVESDQTPTAWFGFSVGTAGDVNGDGYSDVFVGAPDYDNGQSNEGRVFVYLGSASGPGTTADWTAESDQTNAWFGWPAASAGDVNGDGYADLIVGARLFDSGESGEGRAFVYLGSASGLASSAAWTAESNQPDGNFGLSVASAGDVNGDGYSDVIVGAPFFDNDRVDSGRAWVYLGSASGLAATAAWTAGGSRESDFFGMSAATAGDVNGDGYSDVIVGSPGADHGQLNEGRAFVYLGSASGLGTSAAWSAESDENDDQMGLSVASAGDVNGDGYSDAIIGSFHSLSYAGRAVVYLGSPTGLGATVAWTALGPTGFSYFANQVSTAGDVNGDGYSDVIVGAMHYTNGESEEGAAYVFFGSASGLEEIASWTAESDQAEAEMGYSAASAGDVNGDGYSDVIVGVPFYENGATEGRAYLYLGPLVEPPKSLGGSVTGLSTQKVTCQNRTTAGKVAGRTSETTWDCEDLGLAVSAGDQVQTTVRGVVSGSGIVGGSVTRMTPSSVFCRNETTNTRVQAGTSDPSWDCQAMGLVVTAGDTIVTGATGTVD